MIILRGDEINNIAVGTIFMKINRNNYNPNKPNQTDTPPLKNLYVKHEPEESEIEEGETYNITQLSVSPNGMLSTQELNSKQFKKYEWFFSFKKHEAEDIIRYFEWALSGCSKEKERKTIKKEGSDSDVGTA